MTYEELKKKMEDALDTYLKEVTVVTLKIGNTPLPKGLRSKSGKHMVVGKTYLIIPADREERK